MGPTPEPAQQKPPGHWRSPCFQPQPRAKSITASSPARTRGIPPARKAARCTGRSPTHHTPKAPRLRANRPRSPARLLGPNAQQPAPASTSTGPSGAGRPIPAPAPAPADCDCTKTSCSTRSSASDGDKSTLIENPWLANVTETPSALCTTSMRLTRATSNPLCTRLQTQTAQIIVKMRPPVSRRKSIFETSHINPCKCQNNVQYEKCTFRRSRQTQTPQRI